MRISLALTLVLALAGFCFAQQPEMNFPTGPSYLLTNGSPLFARSIATPTLFIHTEMVPQPTPVNISASEEEFLESLPPLPPPDLFPIFYGVPVPQEIYVSFRETSERHFEGGLLPRSIADNGGEITTIAALNLRGYGVTLPQAAAYWKTHEKHAARVYTNADINQLRPQQ